MDISRPTETVANGLSLPSLTPWSAPSPTPRRNELAVPWAETEEFWGQADPATLAKFLAKLAGLAIHAQQKEQHL